MALPNNRRPFDSNISSRKLNKELEFVFDKGWSPVLKPIVDGHKIYLTLDDWIGGEGEKPIDVSNQIWYLGTTGYTTNITFAINIAEHFIVDDWMDEIMSVDDLSFIIQRDSVPINIEMVLNYKAIDDTIHSKSIILFTDNTINIDSEKDNTSNLRGATRRSIAETLFILKNWIVINDVNPPIPWSTNQAMSQYSVMSAINNAKAQFNVPTNVLTTPLIESIESMYGIDNNNPYYMIVEEDDRTGGEHSATCTVSCLSQCCDLNEDGGYEERGNRDGITGCRCTPEVPEVRAECEVEVTSLDSIGSGYQLLIDGVVYTFYVVESGDTISDVVQGLIDNMPNECTHNRNCEVKVNSITATGFTLIADAGMGDTPNSWSLSTTGSVTFTHSINGVTFVPTTYRGVRHHLISYNGTNWNDFGPTLSFGNNNESSSCECTFIHMSDTPVSYTTYSGYVPIVNAAEDSLEFVDFKFLNLNDVSDSNYNSKVGYVPAVNSTPNGLELTDPQSLVNNTFIGLDDTPASYSSEALNGVMVNSGETGLIFTPILTGASNGLTKIGNNVELGGSLIKNTMIVSSTFGFEVRSTSGIIGLYSDTAHLEIEDGIFSITSEVITVTDSSTTPKGMTYGADYSANYIDRSLVDKEYVDNAIDDIDTDNIYNSNGTLTEGRTVDLDENTISFINGSLMATGGGTSVHNTAVGYESLYSITTGLDNTAVGYNSLKENTEGNYNVATGSYSLYGNATGNNNVAIGTHSLWYNTTGSNNIAIGYNSLLNTTVDNNTAVGFESLRANTTGTRNTAVGSESLKENTTGHDNIALGHKSLFSNIAGYNNISIGCNSLYSNTTFNNIAIGFETLYTNTTGYSNVAIGNNSLNLNTVGDINVALGEDSLFSNTEGNGNTSCGSRSLYSNTTGSNNTAVGYQALPLTNYSNTTGVGYNSEVTGNNQVQLGNSATTTYAYGSVVDRSDIRDKADVRDTTLGLDFITKLRPIDFKWDYRDDYISYKDEEEVQTINDVTHDGTHKRTRYHHGFIAQEVETLIKEKEIEDFGGYKDHSIRGGMDVKALGYTEFIAPLVKAVQEQQVIINSLLARIEALEK